MFTRILCKVFNRPTNKSVSDSYVINECLQVNVSFIISEINKLSLFYTFNMMNLIKFKFLYKIDIVFLRSFETR